MVLFYNSSHDNQKDGLVGESDEIIIDNSIIGEFDDNDLMAEEQADDDDFMAESEEDEDVDYDTFDDVDEL